MYGVAINGLGRIGRATFKIVLERADLEIVAVNDQVPAENLAYLLKYDRVYGRYNTTVGHDEDGLTVRAPAPCGWVAALVFLTKRPTSVEEVNNIFREEARSGRYNGILGVTDDPDCVLGHNPGLARLAG